MAVSTQHPDYIEHSDEWRLMRRAQKGDQAIKQAGIEYLPMPSGFTVQSDHGVLAYESYRNRAQFPDLLKPTLRGMVGLIHRQEADISGIEVGKPLAGLWEKATKDGMTLEAFHQSITAEILLMGRYGILVDMPRTNGEVEALPYFVGYQTESIINWSEGDVRDLFVLDESGYRRDTSQADGSEFIWNYERQYRVLRLRNGSYSQQVYQDEFPVAETLVEPTARGNRTFNEIPFIMVGPTTLTLEVEQSPLLGVSRYSVVMYQLDADYRHQLFFSGQETLFITGIDAKDIPESIGSSVVIALPAGGFAEYVGPSGATIAAHKEAIADARNEAVTSAAQLFDRQSGQESGEALRLRYAAQTATLVTIAQASAAALERALRYAATFVGQDPNEIVVKPNLEFVGAELSAEDAKILVDMWMGDAISYETLYENLQRGRIASEERTMEEERDLIEEGLADKPKTSDEIKGEFAVKASEARAAGMAQRSNNGGSGGTQR